MLGGGNFTFQNKKLPGAYINFVSASKASTDIANRGVAAVALNLDWGNDTDIFSVTVEEFAKDALKILGYNYSHNNMKILREMFLNVKKVYIFRLNNAGVKASNTYATAKYSGTRGNDLKVVIAANIDDNTKYDVSLYFGSILVDKQTVTSASNLVDNDYVIWDKTATLATTAGIVLSNGTNGSAVALAHQNFLDKLEAYNFNALCCNSTDETVQTLYINYTKRMRDEVGVKFQTIVYRKTADHEGVINVQNAIVTADVTITHNIIFWITGIIAGCAINKSNTNKKYNGEYEINVEYTQNELETALDEGKCILHKVGDEVRVLEDINSLTTTTSDKGNDFKNNQTIRVLDQAAMDIASLFNTKYLGSVSNNASGRVSLWNDIVSLYKSYYNIQAIEKFNSSDIIVEQGEDKKSVVVNGNITPLNCMTKLYMTILVG